ncbi:MAG: DUF1292 domain-containing protein [Ruminococcaceae bacterium]|nr:DUF1292 domain-containing protein [Oscillospiraceae bacterium]
MINEHENTCGCGHDEENEKVCGTGCEEGGCSCEEETNDSCGCGCGCGDEAGGEGVITMTDTETGEEYSFVIADDFAIEDDHYCVLVTMDENDPELVITKVVTLEDGSEGLMSLDDEEYDRVYTEYERLCEEEDEGDEDADEETEEEE